MKRLQGDYGAKGNGIDDDLGAVIAALTGTVSDTLEVEPGRYALSSSLLFSGHHGSVVFSPGAEFVFMNPTIRGCMLSACHGINVVGHTASFAPAPTVRINLNAALGFEDGDDITISDVTIKNSNAGGVFLNKCRRPIIDRVSVKDTMADGVHLANCEQAKLTDIITDNTGDDGLAFVNYIGGPDYSGGSVARVTVTNSRARGVAIVGQSGVNISNISVDGTSSSGIFVAEDIFYKTQIPKGNSISHATVKNAGRNIPTIGNTFGIEVSSAQNTSLLDVSVVSPLTRGVSVGTQLGTDSLHNVRVKGSPASAFEIRAPDVVMDRCYASNAGSYAYYFADCGRVKAGSLHSKNSGNAALRRVLWADRCVDVEVDQIDVFDSRDTSVPDVVGKSSTKNFVVGRVNYGLRAVTPGGGKNVSDRKMWVRLTGPSSQINTITGLVKYAVDANTSVASGVADMNEVDKILRARPLLIVGDYIFNGYPSDGVTKEPTWPNGWS